MAAASIVETFMALDLNVTARPDNNEIENAGTIEAAYPDEYRTQSGLTPDLYPFP